MLLGDPGKDIHGIRPLLTIFLQSTPLRLSISDVPPQVPVSCHHPDCERLKVLLYLGFGPWGHDQYALGRLWVVALGWSPCLKVPEVFQYLLERPSLPRVIIIP